MMNPSLAMTLTLAILLVANLLTKLWLSGRQVRHVAQHRSQVPATFAHTISLEAHQKAADYTLAKASAALVGPRWRITAVVSNPSDSSGDTFAYGNPFSLRFARQVTPLRPVTFRLSVGMTF